MGVRQRKQQKEIGSSSPRPFLRLFFATGTERTSGEEGTNCHRSESFHVPHPVPAAIPRGCVEGNALGNLPTS